MADHNAHDTEDPRRVEHAPDEAVRLSCTVCHSEIPLSAAVWRESSDYVAHFCGLQCYDMWRNQRRET